MKKINPVNLFYSKLCYITNNFIIFLESSETVLDVIIPNRRLELTVTLRDNLTLIYKCFQVAIYVYRSIFIYLSVDSGSKSN